MDFWETLQKVWKKAAGIAIAWYIVSLAISLTLTFLTASSQNASLSLTLSGIIVLLSFLVTALAGYLSAKAVSSTEFSTAIGAGAIGGAVYGFTIGIVGLIATIFFLVLLAVGINIVPAEIIGLPPDAGAAAGAVLGLAALITIGVQLLIGIPLAVVFGALLGAMGGAVKIILKK